MSTAASPRPAYVDPFAPDHPKIAGLSNEAFRLYWTGVFYSARWLTDGFIPASEATTWAARWAPGRSDVFDELERSSAWHPVAGGWQTHDYLDWQPSRADVEAERAEARERQRRKRGRHVTRDDGRTSRSDAPSTSTPNSAEVLIVPEAEDEGQDLRSPSRVDRAEIYRALSAFQGCVPGQMTRTEARAIGVATSEILVADPGVTPEEVARRGEVYRVRYPGMAATANALKKHWSECAQMPAPRPQGRPDRAALAMRRLAGEVADAGA